MKVTPQHRNRCKCEECYECFRCSNYKELLEYVIDEVSYWFDNEDLAMVVAHTVVTIPANDLRDLIKRIKGAM